MDIVTRLKRRKVLQNSPPYYMIEVPDPECQKAASEITRLRADLAEAQALIKEAREVITQTGEHSYYLGASKTSVVIRVSDLRRAAAWIEKAGMT